MSKLILITGASTGIGAAMARRLAPDNHLILHYNRSVDSVRLVAAAVNELGGTCELHQADLSTQAGCDHLAAAVRADHGHLDVLINNAGGLIKRMPADQLDFEFLAQTFALNTFSAMRMTANCLPLLRNGTAPCIILLTSVAARHGAPTATAYGASKGALDSYCRGLAKELAPSIRVNAIAPGVIETPFHEKVSSPEQMERFKSLTPVGRLGNAEEIADAAAYIIDAGFMTGESIDINGGWNMR